MKQIYRISSLFIVGISILAMVRPNLPGGQKYALIIAIANYPQCPPGQVCWQALSSDKDLVLMKQTLLQQGFPVANILTLADAQATHDGIKQKMADLAGRLHAGDQVVVHYSGHAQQIYDDNGDEIDHLDEALVAYGAPMSASYDTYKGEKHVRDDELGLWIMQLRRAVGPAGHVLVILDSCHSGTASRGQRRQRGGAQPIVPANFTPSRTTAETGSALYENGQRSRGEDGLGNFVLLSGAMANQSNYEAEDDQGNPIGSLTYAVSKAFAQTDKAVSYRGFFANVLSVMATNGLSQTPGIEGDMDVQLFGGSVVTQQPYLAVTKIEPGEARIAGGTLLGIFPGTEISLFPSGTTATKDIKPLLKGEVTTAGPFSAVVKLPAVAAIAQPERVWAFVTRQSYGDFRIKVALDNQLPATLRQLLTDSLQKQPVLTLVTTGADLQLVLASGGLALLRTSDGIVAGETISGPAPAQLLANTLEALRRYSIVRFMRELALKNDDYRASTRVSPTKPDAHPAPNTGSAVALSVGKPAWITVRNEGPKPFFFNLVDFQPDGIASVVLPGVVPGGRQYTPDDLTLKPGDSVTFQVDVGPPEGLELHRVFVGPEPFDLRPAFSTFRTRGPDSPVEHLLQTMLDTPTGSRGTTLRFDPGMGGVTDFSFQIVK
ncbi:caspase family protein [Spirosoma areae]